MAHVQAHPGHDFSPEEAVREIQTERKRNSLIALAVGVGLFLLFGVGIYLSYNDTPSPENPANAKPSVAEPYR
jgi:hypothetical protein